MIRKWWKWPVLGKVVEEKVEKEKITPAVVCKKKLGVFKDAKKVSEEYAQLSSCCTLLAALEQDDTAYLYRYGNMYSNGWNISGGSLKNIGVDIDDVYSFIRELVVKRKVELEESLESLTGSDKVVGDKDETN